MATDKVLIIRFSSFGDINQCMFAALKLKEKHKDAELHWLTRSDFSDYLQNFKNINKVIDFHRSAGLIGLIKLGLHLRAEKYSLIYDAHNNLRSKVIKLIIGFPFTKTITRPKNRFKRILLFKFRKNLFPSPFQGGFSYITPLKKLIETNTQELPFPDFDDIKKVENYILLAPAATWPLKEWSIQKWHQLVQSTNNQFVIVGGPTDEWLDKIKDIAPERVQNLAGQLSWSESLDFVRRAKMVIGVDTGITHLADLIGKDCNFIIGPSAFGYPSRATSRVTELELWCKPCTKDGRGKCYNKVHKKCLNELDPCSITKGLQ